MGFIGTDYHNKCVEQAEYRDEGADTSMRFGQVLTDEDMVEIWFDLARISTPTWVTPIPLDLGSASHGKLKADQWRTLGITHLPLSPGYGGFERAEIRSRKSARSCWMSPYRSCRLLFWRPPGLLHLQLQLHILPT